MCQIKIQNISFNFYLFYFFFYADYYKKFIYKTVLFKKITLPSKSIKCFYLEKSHFIHFMSLLKFCFS